MFNPETGQWVNVNLGMGLGMYPFAPFMPGMRPDFYPNHMGFRGRGGFRGRARGRGGFRGGYRGRGGGPSSYDHGHHDYDEYDDSYDYKRNRDRDLKRRDYRKRSRSNSRSRSMHAFISTSAFFLLSFFLSFSGRSRNIRRRSRSDSHNKSRSGSMFTLTRQSLFQSLFNNNHFQVDLAIVAAPDQIVDDHIQTQNGHVHILTQNTHIRMVKNPNWYPRFVEVDHHHHIGQNHLAVREIIVHGQNVDHLIVDRKASIPQKYHHVIRTIDQSIRNQNVIAARIANIIQLEKVDKQVRDIHDQDHILNVVRTKEKNQQLPKQILIIDHQKNIHQNHVQTLLIALNFNRQNVRHAALRPKKNGTRFHLKPIYHFLQFRIFK